MSRKTVTLLSCVAAAALTIPVSAQVSDGQPHTYGDYNAASTVEAGFNTVEEEAAAIRIYQQSLHPQTQPAPVQYAQTAQTTQIHEFPMAKTYSSREAALADIQVEIFDTPIPANTQAARNATYGTSYTQNAAATTTIETPSYTYTAPATTTVTTFGSASTYVVNQGDTLYAIGRKYGLKASDLMNANGLNGSAISIGQVLTIPGASTAPSATYVQAPSYTQSVTSASTTAYSDYSVPATTIVRNDLPIPSGKDYGVLPGDTLSSIARRSCVTPTAIALASGIALSTTLMPGDMLTLPAGNCAK